MTTLFWTFMISSVVFASVSFSVGYFLGKTRGVFIFLRDYFKVNDVHVPYSGKICLYWPGVEKSLYVTAGLEGNSQKLTDASELVNE